MFVPSFTRDSAECREAQRRSELYGGSPRHRERRFELTVSDTGNGFEEQDAFTRHGLGLISMRERLQLVNGELSSEIATRGWHYDPRSRSVEN